MARRYLLNSVEKAINQEPAWSLGRDLEAAVNRDLVKNGFTVKRIGAARIGILAKILVDEGRVIRRRISTGKIPESRKRRFEYRAIFRIVSPDFSGLFNLLFSPTTP